MPLPFEVYAISRLYLIWGIKARQRHAPILFFFEIYIMTLAKGVPVAILQYAFSGSIMEAVAAMLGRP